MKLSKGHSSHVQAVTLTKKSNMLISASDNNTLKVWSRHSALSAQGHSAMQFDDTQSDNTIASDRTPA